MVNVELIRLSSCSTPHGDFSRIGVYLDEATKGAGTGMFLAGSRGRLPVLAGRRPRGCLFD